MSADTDAADRSSLLLVDGQSQVIGKQVLQDGGLATARPAIDEQRERSGLAHDL